jgi:glycosyltransferase involved in cell wall biosynthesis
MGAGPFFNHIVDYAKELGVWDSITFTGRADNETICRVLSSADLAVDPCPPSPHANLSTATKIMEYMYFSLPIVAFDLLETRRSGADAVCYADTETTFVSQIVDLLKDESKRKALGCAARHRLDATLSWDRSAETLVDLMGDLVGVPAPQLEELATERMLQATEATSNQPIVAFESGSATMANASMMTSRNTGFMQEAAVNVSMQ